MITKITNWSVGSSGDQYTAPELRFPVLQGIVTNHPRFDDGSSITSGRIVRLEEGKVVTSTGTIFELGEIDPDYEKIFPNARERFFNSFDEKGAMKRA